MTFNQLLEILKARWITLSVVFALTVLTTLIVSSVLPKQYTATASVLVDVKSADPIQGFAMQSMSVPGYMATQTDVIRSERVARKVVQLTGLTNNAAMQEKWREETEGVGSYEVWLAKLLAKQLDVTPTRDSNVINISYTATDPGFAALIANTFIRAYLAVNLELRVEPAKQYTAMFEEQSKLLREQLEESQTRLSSYQKEKGLIATDERLDVENTRLNELSSQLVALQALAAESTSRRAQAGANSPEVLNNSVIGALKADVSRQEARLKEIAAKYGSAHPQVLELQANISELNRKIDSEMARVTGSLGVNSTVNSSREAQARAAVEAQRQKVLKLKEQRDEAAVLLRDVESAQRAYESVRARLMQTSLESQSNQTNIMPLESATEPTSASSPKVFLNTLLSVVLGAALAVGTALAIELTDRRMRSRDDVTALLDMPLLAQLPRVSFNGSDTAKKESGFFLAGRSTPQPKLNAPV
jgi:polysaccharide biosynthesis transport protein